MSVKRADAQRATFIAMLTALGRKDFDAFESYLDPEIVCEWPYLPLKGFPAEMTGASVIRRSFEAGMRDFTPYNYKILKIHDMADPDVVIAEYISDSTYLPRQAPYSNQYLGIMHFRAGKIVRWKEYVNPVTILEAMGIEQDWAQRQKEGA